MNDLDLTNTLKAIPVWKAREEVLIEMLKKVRTDAGWTQWKAKELKNDDMLRKAFYKDTKDRNSLNAVLMMPVRDIIRFAETGSWR